MTKLMRKTKPEPADPGDGSRALANARWELFCQNYAGPHRRNATRSYNAAGYHTRGHRADTACGLKLLAVACIKKRIEYLEAQALEQVRLTALDANARLGVIATATLSDFLDEYGRVDIARVRDPALAPAVKRCRALRDTEGNIIDYDLELHDPMRALELQGLTEKKESSVTAVQQVLIIEH